MTARLHVTRPDGPWPLAFGCGAGHLPGWWHPAGGGDVHSLPVVLCPAIGWEAEATFRTRVRWAELLAAAGFPVLRFDYSGTGDAPGSDEDPARVAAWVASVHAAVEAARRMTGAPRVALAGLQMGATLAAHAAAERTDVEALVAWGPLVTGRGYVRQLRAYRLLNALPTDPRGAPSTSDEEAAGYRLSRSTVSELEAIDLRALSRAPAPRVLLCSQDGEPDEALAVAWRQRGARVTLEVGTGWQQMMQQPRKSVVPESVLARTAAFLGEVAGVKTPAPESAPGPELEQRRWAAARDVVEEAVCLGENGMMAGVLSAPLRERSEALPTVLFLTTASHQHIGPNRLWVRLARALSDLGLRTFRFDLTGVGDSLLLPGESPTHAYGTESVPEVREVMDALERSTGARRFVVVGLCSGAYLAYHAAVADPRVEGVVAVNPQTFTWKEGDSLDVRQRQTLGSMRYYRKALLRLETWRRAFRGELQLRHVSQVLVARGWRRLRERAAGGLRPEEPEVGRNLRGLVQRGTDVYFLFGEDDEGVDALQREAGPVLRRLSRASSFEVELVEGPSHTFEQLWAQELLTERVVERLSRRLGLGARKSAAG
ncbi:MAG TPA: alpha/beta fold hydrolase [Myxococcaceae bacterium]|nr:alpha/beta fold hydrolase [Myxococcaceae bacterium]